MLSLDPETRRRLYSLTADLLERYAAEVEDLPVAPRLDPGEIRAALAPVDFQTPASPEAALQFAADGLRRWQVHTPHPRYFGLFNPAPTAMGVFADTLVAGFNPQIAAWSHSPFAAEVEAHLVRALGAKFGYGQTDGTFCSGGMEANHTAVLTALAHAFPNWIGEGLRGLPGQPVMYVSADSHHSFRKAARMCGLGEDALREIAIDENLQMQPGDLRDAVERDRRAGHSPFLIAATAGTTVAGAIDPLPEISAIARREGMWMHTDAAWGGAAALVPELRGLLNGVEQSDSITFDAHKWLSVPMGAGVYLTRHADILERTFRVASPYMPKEAEGLDIVDPHLHSMQWSRRFTGLKVFLSLMVAGWSGYEQALRHQTRMGDVLRQALEADGWNVVNRTPLPVVCFTRKDASALELRDVADRVLKAGQAWISTAALRGLPVLRACITHFDTQEQHVRLLVSSLRGY